MDNTNATSQTAKAGRFLSFSLGKTRYAIPLLCVKEVIAIPQIKTIPQTPAYFLGVINLRGNIIPIVDLHRRLDIPAEITEDSCVIICDLAPTQIGLVVSSVNQVLNLSEKEIAPRPDGQGNQNRAYITGLAKLDIGMVMLIDVASCLEMSDRGVLDKTLTGTGRTAAA